ncbi:MAG TPA: sensor histidine kinase [Acidimicrobiales bacterium]|nr:sensor histidine kinase [Acidimicrobiales bacterium]
MAPQLDSASEHRWSAWSARWSAWMVAAVVVTCTGATLELRWANRHTPVSTWWQPIMAIGLGLSLLGVILLRKRPANPIGWVAAAGGIGQLLTAATREWAVFAHATRGGLLPGAALAGWVGTWTYLSGAASLPLVLVLFPDGDLPSPRWRWLLRSILVIIVASIVVGALTPGPFTTEMPDLVNPVGVDLPLLLETSGALNVAMVVVTLAAAWSLLQRYRRRDEVTRQQIRLVTFAGVVTAGALALSFTPIAYEGVLGMAYWLMPSCVALFVGSVAVAVLRYRLWDLDVIVRLSLVYGALSILLIGIYAGLVAALTTLVGGSVAVGPSLAAATVVAVAFAPVREVVQRGIDRALYGHAHDARQARIAFEGSIGRPEPVDDALDDIVSLIVTSLRVDGVVLGITGQGIVASAGANRSDAHRVELCFREEDVGWLEITARAGAPLGRAGRRTLAELAPSVAATVGLVEVNAALEQSRKELLSARAEERWRIRRDLHDGLGPTLAAIAMQLDGTRAVLDTTPDAAKAQLERLGDELRQAIVEIRRVVHDLQPPVLGELGLIAALADQASSFSSPAAGAGLEVELRAPSAVSDVPAAVELAVYRIVGEALTNVARHAGARRCSVTVDLVDAGRTLVVQIDDDGRGVADDAPAGMGTTSMVDRARELGGSCSVERSPCGGTRVRASLPLDRPGHEGDRRGR